MSDIKEAAEESESLADSFQMPLDAKQRKMRNSIIFNISKAVNQLEHDKMMNQFQNHFNDDKFSQDDSLDKSHEGNQEGIELYDSYMNISRQRSKAISGEDVMQFEPEYQKETIYVKVAPDNLF